MVVGVALIPLGIGGVNGVLETTVVQGDVPLLLPVRLLTALEVLIDMKYMVMHSQMQYSYVPTTQWSCRYQHPIVRRRQVRGSPGSGGTSGV